MNNKVITVLQKQQKPNQTGLQEILEGLPHGVALFDHALVLTHWNSRFIDLLDLKPSFPEPGTYLCNILDIIRNIGQKDSNNNFAAKILSELSKARTSNELFPFSYEYNLNKGKTLEIKGEVLPNSGLILTFTDISLRSNPNYYLHTTPGPGSLQSYEDDSLWAIEAQYDREMMENEAAKAVEMAEELAITREIAENSARHIEAILNAISDVLVTMDVKGNIMTCNRAAKKIFGYTTNEIIGKNLLFLVNTVHIMAGTDIGKFIISLEGDDQLRKQDGTGYRKNGTTFPIEINIRKVEIGSQKQFTVVISDVTERHDAEMLIREMALHDSLTGLANRNLLQQRLDEAMRMAMRMDKKISVMFLDLDRFKQVNDIYGHVTGDKLLRVVADRLENCVREIDTVARLGGDEFAIISTNIGGEQDIAEVAQRILRTIKEPIIIGDNSHLIGTSIGISFYPQDSRDPAELFRMADVALYQAKDAGKNTFQLFNPEMDTRARTEKQIEVDLEKAIDRDELILHFQPLLDAIDNSIVATEALVRWDHPDQGMIPPMSFIPVAEKSKLILKLGQKILEMACIQGRKWRDRADMSNFRICVNISARQFQSKDFVGNVEHALEISGLAPEGLELEITEGMVIGDTETVAKKLKILARRGISLAIDDFGTGYSSLAYLRRFEVDRLKIDQSFIQHIAEKHEDEEITKIIEGRAITGAIINLGQSIGLTVVAEGVETIEQAKILREMKCDILQGYLFSKPIPAAEFEQWAINHMKEFNA
ncbi:MAG: EAL domain-containing protein [Alphaproteobacteria bacterium]|nr:EAL domain-containing protein [Alphaproteobacteria bacterium]